MSLLPMTPLRTALKVSDLGVMGTSVALTTWLLYGHQAEMSLSEFLALRVTIKNFILVCGFVVGWHLIFRGMGHYRLKASSHRLDECLDIIKAMVLSTGLMAVMAIVWQMEMVSPLFLIVFFVLCTGLLIGSRFVMRSWLWRFLVPKDHTRNLVIVGTNPRAVGLANKIEANPDLRCRVIGFVDEEWPGLQEFSQSGFPKVSDFSRFPALLRSVVVDEVIIGLPLKSYYQQSADIVRQCEEQGVQVQLLHEIFPSVAVQKNGGDMASHTLLPVSPSVGLDHSHVLKRVLDIVISLSVILVFSPFFVLVAAGIKCTSPGPVFFIQDRIGLNKRRFRLIKFRTMVTDAEARLADLEHLNEVHGAAFKLRNDPRVTTFGKFLRKTSLDEFPQFFNVLKGEMSLVGPRPLPVRDFEGFTEDWHRRRFAVRPGITCLWQVNGRSQLSFDKWMELDLQYIDEWSLWLDLKILLKTIPVVVKGTGAV